MIGDFIDQQFHFRVFLISKTFLYSMLTVTKLIEKAYMFENALYCSLKNGLKLYFIIAEKQ